MFFFLAFLYSTGTQHGSDTSLYTILNRCLSSSDRNMKFCTLLTSWSCLTFWLQYVFPKKCHYVSCSLPHNNRIEIHRIRWCTDTAIFYFLNIYQSVRRPFFWFGTEAYMWNQMSISATILFWTSALQLTVLELVKAFIKENIYTQISKCIHFW